MHNQNDNQSNFNEFILSESIKTIDEAKISRSRTPFYLSFPIILIAGALFTLFLGFLVGYNDAHSHARAVEFYLSDSKQHPHTPIHLPW